MKGKFSTKGSWFAGIISLIVGIFAICCIFIPPAAGEKAGVPEIIVFAVLGAGLIAFAVFRVVSTMRRTLEITDSEIVYNGKSRPLSEAVSVLDYASGMSADVTVTFKDEKNLSIKALENHAEVADFIKRRLTASFGSDVEAEKKEIGSLEKKSRISIAILCAFFFALIAIFIITAVAVSRNVSGRTVLLLGLDIVIVSAALLMAAKRTSSVLGMLAGRKLALRRLILTAEPDNAEWIKIYADPDYYLRLIVSKEGKEYGVLGEIVTEDYSLHTIDEKERYSSLDKLMSEIDTNTLTEIKSK